MFALPLAAFLLLLTAGCSPAANSDLQRVDRLTGSGEGLSDHELLDWIAREHPEPVQPLEPIHDSAYIATFRVSGALRKVLWKPAARWKKPIDGALEILMWEAAVEFGATDPEVGIIVPEPRLVSYPPCRGELSGEGLMTVFIEEGDDGFFDFDRLEGDELTRANAIIARFDAAVRLPSGQMLGGWDWVWNHGNRKNRSYPSTEPHGTRPRNALILPGARFAAIDNAHVDPGTDTHTSWSYFIDQNIAGIPTRFDARVLRVFERMRDAPDRVRAYVERIVMLMLECKRLRPNEWYPGYVSWTIFKTTDARVDYATEVVLARIRQLTTLRHLSLWDVDYPRL